MKAFETAQLISDRLNGGNESKFPVTLAIVSEIIVLCKLRLGADKVEEVKSLLSSSIADDQIMFLINDLDDESELRMVKNVQNFFETNDEGVRTINAGIRILRLLGLFWFFG